MNHLQKLCESSVLVKNNLCGKLVSSLQFPIQFDQRFEVTSVPFFIADFNLLSCELENFTCYLEQFISIFY